MKNTYALICLLVAAPALAAEAPVAAPDAAAPAPEAAAPAPEAVAAPAPAPATTGTVARAQFTSAVQDREPVDALSNLANDSQQIYFFTELKDMGGHTITHRWEHGGKVMAEVKFDVAGARWRVYSSKTLDPAWTGEWKVAVVDEAGTTLGASTFTYEAAAAAPAPAPAAEPAAPAAPAPAPSQ